MIRHCVFILMLICLNMGCVTTHKPSSVNDPLEIYNRSIYGFNTAVDKAILRPVAKTYAFITPAPIDQGVGNFFNNINQINTIANDLLQADIHYTMKDAWRFAINSTVGLFGIFDIASKVGLENHTQDFGLTLAKWGITDSPYFVIPLLGPSTVRDILSFPVDYYTLSAWPYIKPSPAHYTLYVLQRIHQRKALLVIDKLVNEAFDPYVLVRSAYLQKREHMMNADIE